VYAVLQSMAMVIHRFFYRRSGRTGDTVDSWQMHAFKVFWALQFVVFSRILFRATSLQNAADITTRLGSGTFSVAQVSLGVWTMLLLTFAAHYTPRRWFGSIELGFKSMPAPAQGVTLAVLGLILSVVATSEVVPYIYFQF
jgi:alginate O-acetyltransferase complex protein AlgI